MRLKFLYNFLLKINGLEGHEFDGDIFSREHFINDVKNGYINNDDGIAFLCNSLGVRVGEWDCIDIDNIESVDFKGYTHICFFGN